MAALDEQKFAEEYGWALSFFKSNKELYGLLRQAVKGDWNAETFQAKIRETGWFRKSAESVRKYQLLRSQDPATLAQRRAQLISQLRDAAGEMGATMSGSTLSKVAENALMYSWNDSQIRDTLSQYVHATNTVYKGEAADTTQKINQLAYRNGVRISAETRESWAQKIAAGDTTIQSVEAAIRNQAKALAPAYADAIDAGQDLIDIASPYIESKAKILEKSPSSIDLWDNDIRSALSAKGADGKPASKSLWQFEQDMRSSPEWMTTKNAQDNLNSVGLKVLKDMGVMA